MIHRPVGAVDDRAISFDESKIKAANVEFSAFVGIYGLRLNGGWCTAFENLGQLESLHIDFSDITAEELRRLQESLPKTRVTAPAPQSNERGAAGGRRGCEQVVDATKG